MIVVGVTGGICSGKSQLLKVLSPLAPCFDADKIAHQAYLPGTECVEKIANVFGKDIINEDGTVNRQKLGAIVFSDKSELKKLTDIVWPELKRILKNQIKQLEEENIHKVLFIEAAILIEADIKSLCDEIWIFETDIDSAIKRLKERNNLDEEEARKRINSQLSNDERRPFGTKIFYNPYDKELSELEKEILDSYNQLINK